LKTRARVFSDAFPEPIDSSPSVVGEDFLSGLNDDCLGVIFKHLGENLVPLSLTARPLRNRVKQLKPAFFKSSEDEITQQPGKKQLLKSIVSILNANFIPRNATNVQLLKRILTRHLKLIVKVFFALDKLYLLDNNSFVKILSDPEGENGIFPQTRALLLTTLEEKNLLTQENLNKILDVSSPIDLKHTLGKLIKVFVLDQKLLDLVFRDLDYLRKAILQLNDLQIATTTNIRLFSDCRDRDSLLRILDDWQEPLTYESICALLDVCATSPSFQNIESMSRIRDSGELLEIVHRCSLSGMNDRSYFLRFFTYPDPIDLSSRLLAHGNPLTRTAFGDALEVGSDSMSLI
jgi:hypothetical protein